MTKLNFETTTVQQSAVAMPMRERTLDASAHTSQMGGVSAAAKARLVDVAPVCAYLGSDVVVIKGAFPGTSAWSPPI